MITNIIKIKQIIYRHLMYRIKTIGKYSIDELRKKKPVFYNRINLLLYNVLLNICPVVTNSLFFFSIRYYFNNVYTWGGTRLRKHSELRPWV